MKQTSKWFAAMLCLAVTASAHANNYLTSATINPSVVTVGQSFNVSVAGDAICYATFQVDGNTWQTWTNAKWVNGKLVSQPNTPGVVTIAGGISKPGTYEIVASAQQVPDWNKELPPRCYGSVKATVVVKPSIRDPQGQTPPLKK